MLTHRFPYPPNRGDRIRSYHLLRVLSEHFCVTLACPADEPVPSNDREHVQSLCEDLYVAPLGRRRRLGSALKSFAMGKSLTEGLFASRNLAQQVNRSQQQRPYDAVLVFCSSMFPYVAQRSFADTPMIVDLIDVDSQKWHQMGRESRFPKNYLYAAESRRVKHLEQRIADRADAMVLVSDSEAELFRQTVTVNKPTVGISNGVDSDYFQPPSASAIAVRREPPDAALRLVFTGVLDYSPNVEGMVWFCHQVMPQLRRQIDVKLSIVGRRPCRRVTELASIEGVEVVGEVPDVRPYLNRANIAISPLQLARGIQNKVLEAMAAGLPVVLTSPSAEGIDAVSGREYWIADTVDQWCTALTSLAADKVACERMGCAARQLVEAEYSWSARLAAFVDILNAQTAVRPADGSKAKVADIR